MRIGFSARGLSTPSGGVHEFIKSLIPALAAERGEDEFFVFYNDGKFLGHAPDCSEVAIQGNNRIWWDFFVLPRMLAKFKIDAAIFPKNLVPFWGNQRSYAVVHDLAYFDSRLNAYPFLDTMYMRTLIPRSLRRAAGVFAVSEHTKRDITRYTNCDPGKIAVTYEAAGAIYHPIEDDWRLREAKEKYDLPESFIMYVGSLSPRKNIPGLLKAYSSICAKIPHDLVLTGSKSWKDSPVYRMVRDLNLGSRIRRLGYVEREDMPALYNLAGAYVYPSLYEGFGLPVLEAMQCGCPVVASNATSIPEVAGDAAMLIDPGDVGAIADAICRVLTEDDLRSKLVDAGFEQAKKFSWRRCARMMLETIRADNAERV